MIRNRIALLCLSLFLSCTTGNEIKSPPNTSSTSNADESVQEIFAITNEQRRQRKLEPFSTDERLMKAAGEYARLMAKEDQLTHEVAGDQLSERVGRAGYPWKTIGENIAENPALKGRDIVVQQWMQSSGHKANILSKGFTHIGIGVAGPSRRNKYYYCQIFASPWTR